MASRLVIAISLGLLIFGSPAVGQDSPTLIATYYRCNTGLRDQTDQIIRERIGPIFARHAGANHITSWGWMSHGIGGEWRRILYLIGPSRDQAWDWWTEIVSEFQSEEALAVARLNDICGSHDDYIWQQVSTSEIGGDGTSALATASTYFVCEQSREDRADEIFQEVVRPIYEEHVDAGDLGGWSWWRHDVGGPYRRLLVLNGFNHKEIMNGRDATNETVWERAPDAMREFLSICQGHEDYLWSRVLPENEDD